MDAGNLQRTTRRKHVFVLAIVSVAVCLSGAFGEYVWIDHVEIEQAGYRVTSFQDLQKVWSMSLDSYLERNEGVSAAPGGYYRPVYAIDESNQLILFDPSVFGTVYKLTLAKLLLYL